ncbi:hypothetical protein DSECCO2_594280 [anaerobic digester metagenome]
MVGGRGDLHRLPPDIHAEREELLEHHREPGLDCLRGEVGYVEVDPTAVRSPALQHLGRDRPGHHVAGREFHPGGVVVLHEPLPPCV